MRFVIGLTLCTLLISITSCSQSSSENRTPSTTGLRVERTRVLGVGFVVARVDLKTAHVSLRWKNNTGQRYGSFEQVIKETPQRILFATNAGIFDPNHTPCGWHVEESRELVALNLQDGEGNFFLKPNGALSIGTEALIRESSEISSRQNIRMATQSGPLLLHNGQIHPKFTQGSPNKVIRSGVGLVSKTELCFVISDEPVNFYDFARFFQTLGCLDALYLDGAISKFYAPQAGLTDMGGDFAGIFTVEEP